MSHVLETENPVLRYTEPDISHPVKWEQKLNWVGEASHGQGGSLKPHAHTYQGLPARVLGAGKYMAVKGTRGRGGAFTSRL